MDKGLPPKMAIHRMHGNNLKLTLHLYIKMAAELCCTNIWLISESNFTKYVVLLNDSIQGFLQKTLYNLVHAI